MPPRFSPRNRSHSRSRSIFHYARSWASRFQVMRLVIAQIRLPMTFPVSLLAPFLALLLSFQITVFPPPLKAETISLWPLSETTPSHVHAVWININKLLLKIADRNMEDPVKLNQINSLSLKKVGGKIPRDVLGQVNRFRIILDQSRLRHSLSPSSNSRDLSQKAMQPRTVFINSLLVLDSLQEWERRIYGDEISFAPFYRFEVIPGKEPSDVFSQVVLATKRLQLLIK